MAESTSDGSKEIPAVEDLHRELVELRQQLERERLLRMMMEERARALETQLLHSQVSRQSSPLLPSSLPSPINLKVVSKIPCCVQLFCCEVCGGEGWVGYGTRLLLVSVLVG